MRDIRHNLLRLLAACALLGRTLTTAPVRAEDSPHAYAIEASLDAAQKKVRGRARIRFTNTSARPLSKLLFHLYLNAFRDRESVFMRESRGSMRGQVFTSRGAIDLKTLRVNGVERLAKARRELVPGDFTQLEIPLAVPLAPGESVSIESTFVSTLPKVFARSGHAGDFFCVAQWFPKLAKLEPNGEFAGFPYHALGEFYADFADYELTLRTPFSFEVGANGRLVREAREGETRVRVFSMRRVHDAVWVASPFLMRHTERVGEVDVHYLHPPGYQLALREHASTVRAGLAHFGHAFGPYPYPTLTVVIPPRQAAGAAGMEYPGLFITAGAWFEVPGSPGLSGAFVSAHELAHQWFSGVIATNEVRSPVLDEGFAQWAAIDLLRTRFGERGALSRFSPVSRFEVERLLSLYPKKFTAPGRPAFAFTPAEYGASVYARAAVVLESIRRAHGKSRFEEAMRNYATRARFGHPTPEDLAHAFDAVYGVGFADRVLLPLLIEGQSCAVYIAEARSEPEGSKYLTKVRARRDGSVALPTWIAAYGARGKELARAAWPASVDTLETELQTSERVAYVAADPDRALLVDLSTEDQLFVFEAPQKYDWLSHIMAALQWVVAWVGP